MQWWEFILLFSIMALFMLPTILKLTKKKKVVCSCGCESCHKDCPLHK